jgi:hypothetical protein
MFAKYESKGQTRDSAPTDKKHAEPEPGKALEGLRALQRGLGNTYLQTVSTLHQPEQDARFSGERLESNSPNGNQRDFKSFGSAGGLAGLNLDVTFDVSSTPATSLQAIQVFWGTRRTDNLKVGKMSFVENTKTYDAFVDGGINSPYVTLGGNSPAHPTMPYYLTVAEVAKQVKFSKDAGTIQITDLPGAVALHDEANFETAIVAVAGAGPGKDKLLKAFDWGWTAKGTKPTVDPKTSTEIAGKKSGLNIKDSISARFTSIVKSDYPTYTLS